MTKGIILNNFVFTTCKNSIGSPLIDKCNTTCKDETFYGYAIRIPFTWFCFVVANKKWHIF
jgi:hypothetical protein